MRRVGMGRGAKAALPVGTGRGAKAALPVGTGRGAKATLPEGAGRGAGAAPPVGTGRGARAALPNESNRLNEPPRIHWAPVKSCMMLNNLNLSETYSKWHQAKSKPIKFYNMFKN
jgi:hypothetical protein